MRAAAMIVLAMGCSNSSVSPPTASDPCADGGSYVRLGVTDEACHVFVEEESRGNVVVDPYKGPIWSSPSTGASLSRAAPPTFTWSKGTLASIPRWRRWLALEGTAHAHGDTTGDAFVATFRDANGKELLRVLTTELSYSPDGATWARLAAGASLRIDLAQMRLVRNVIATGTKVTAAAQLTFTVAP